MTKDDTITFRVSSEFLLKLWKEIPKDGNESDSQYYRRIIEDSISNKYEIERLEREVGRLDVLCREHFDNLERKNKEFVFVKNLIERKALKLFRKMISDKEFEVIQKW